jgi:predicted 3-demethylubiquinone-9 3-methyltransferase (glyoxalase superfamily)
MQPITPHLWFNTQAKEATALYATLFPNSQVTSVTTIHGTPSGDSDIVSFQLAGQKFMAISAGPIFKFNPSISMFVTFQSEAEIEAVWNKLVDGGTVMMAYDTYPWAHKYGWLNDKYGLSWQLSYSDNHVTRQQITPMLMFTKAMVGKVKEAVESYTNIFPNSHIEMMVPYGPGEGDTEGFIKHSRFTLNGCDFMAMESSGKHEFSFNEAISFMVNCETQEEIDHYWNALSAVPEAEQCGWLKDKYGVSWQIVPTAMNEMMARGDKDAVARVTKAFMTMKKFDIATLRAAYKGK